MFIMNMLCLNNTVGLVLKAMLLLRFLNIDASYSWTFQTSKHERLQFLQLNFKPTATVLAPKQAGLILLRLCSICRVLIKGVTATEISRHFIVPFVSLL